MVRVDNLCCKTIYVAWLEIVRMTRIHPNIFTFLSFWREEKKALVRLKCVCDIVINIHL